MKKQTRRLLAFLLAFLIPCAGPLAQTPGTTESPAVQKARKMLGRVDQEIGGFYERRRANKAENRLNANEDILGFIYDSTALDERKSVATRLAEAHHLDAQKKDHLHKVSESRERFVKEYHMAFEGKATPDTSRIKQTLHKRKAALHEIDGGYLKVVSSAGNRPPIQLAVAAAVIYYDWGCVWAYGGLPGSEVGPDFWTASWLCLFAAIATGQRSLLFVHTHSSDTSDVYAGGPVWEW